MKRVQILSGNFATGEGKKGNYSGYDKDNERYFISQRLMASNGWATDKEVVLPFWANTGVKQIGQLNAEGEPLTLNGVPVLVDRTQVLSIFKTREDLVNSEIDTASIEIDIASGIRAKGKSAGLTEDVLQALLTASF